MELFFQENFIVLILLMLWVLPWKGYALWIASTHNHKWWFVALLVVNTLAILDIVYIFAVAKRGPALYRFFAGENASLPSFSKKEKEENPSHINGTR
ncbi:MAG: DUF5652 family protein [Candidatus Paceibacterota bacterium]